MQIIPTVYILDGQCVSLYKGDLVQKKTYNRKPSAYVESLAKQGFKKVLIVDVNAIHGEKEQNDKAIQTITTNNPNLEVQYVGSIDSVKEVSSYIEKFKISKVIIGIAGLPIIPKCIRTFGEDRIYSGVRAYGKDIISRALANSYEVFDFGQELENLGIKNFFYHDVLSEGTLIHPNYDEVERIIKTTDLNVFIMGGISKIKHLNLLRKIGVKGAYIGKALMEGMFDTDELLRFEELFQS